LEEQWNTMFELLTSYNKRERNLNVPVCNVEESEMLGHWLDRQRNLMKNNKLCGDRQQKLEAIGVVWDRIEDLEENGT